MGNPWVPMADHIDWVFHRSRCKFQILRYFPGGRSLSCHASQPPFDPHLRSVISLSKKSFEVAVWLEMPFDDLQRLCRSNGIHSIANEHQRGELVLGLVKVLWALPVMPKSSNKGKGSSKGKPYGMQGTWNQRAAPGPRPQAGQRPAFQFAKGGFQPGGAWPLARNTQIEK